MSSNVLAHRMHTVELGPEQLLLFADRPGTRLQVLFGGLWLTEEGCLQDRFGAAGQWLRLEAGGLAVAEALGPTRVRVIEPPRRLGASWRRVLPQWRPRLQAWTTRTLAATLALLLSVGLPEMMARGFLGDGRHAAVASGSA